MPQKRGRSWCFTINNYTDADLAQLMFSECKYIIYGKEVAPDTGTPHLQGYVQFPTMKSLRQVKEQVCDRAHFEIAKGSPAQNIAYCSKEGDFQERGDRPTDGGAEGGAAEKQRWNDAKAAILANRLDDIPADILIRHVHAVAKIQELFRPMPQDADNLTGVWYFGPAGAGKSRAAREHFPGAYLKNCNKWWDGYNDEDYVIIEDFDPGHHGLGHHLKIWSDRYAFAGEVKGGTKRMRPKKIIVTSQYHPDEIWPDLQTRAAIIRRFDFVEFPQQPLAQVASPDLHAAELWDSQATDVVSVPEPTQADDSGLSQTSIAF